MIETRTRRTSGELEAHIGQLSSVIDSLPEAERAKLKGLVQETRERHAQVEEDITRAYDLVDDWRLSAKWRVFNAEARQREAQIPREDSGDMMQAA